jgi:hypothetical protein
MAPPVVVVVVFIVAGVALQAMLGHAQVVLRQ